MRPYSTSMKLRNCSSIFVLVCIALLLGVVGCAGSKNAVQPATEMASNSASKIQSKLVDISSFTPAQGARMTKKGVHYAYRKKGEGTKKPYSASIVKVHYEGFTTDGKKFDSSKDRGQPASFPLDKVIPGFQEVITYMVEGDDIRCWIPKHLAYDGKEGAPKGMLVFDVHLIAIESR